MSDTNLITVNTDDCWLYASTHTSKSGHGMIYERYQNGRTYSQQAYRVMYENMVGPIPDGLEVDHLCEVPQCINPAHLEPVTHQENTLRHYRRQTHCRKGHEYTPENTYWKIKKTNKSPSRYCKKCMYMGKTRYKQSLAHRIP